MSKGCIDVAHQTVFCKLLTMLLVASTLRRMCFARLSLIVIATVALGGGRAWHVQVAIGQIHSSQLHSHGHWHGDEFHEHFHSHIQPLSDPVDAHAQEPHEHSFTGSPEEESETATNVATSARRIQPIPRLMFVGMVGGALFSPESLNRSPTAPPPRSRAGPEGLGLAAWRSIKLQV